MLWSKKYNAKVFRLCYTHYGMNSRHLQWRAENTANKAKKNKLARKTLKPNEYYNPETKRYEYHYKDALGK